MGREKKLSTWTQEQIEARKAERARLKALEEEALRMQKTMEAKEVIGEKEARKALGELTVAKVFGKTDTGMVDQGLTSKIKEVLSSEGINLSPESKLAVIAATSGRVNCFDLYEYKTDGESITRPESPIDKIRMSYQPNDYLSRALSGRADVNEADVQKIVVYNKTGSTRTINAKKVIPNKMDRLDITIALVRAVLPQASKAA